MSMAMHNVAVGCGCGGAMRTYVYVVERAVTAGTWANLIIDHILRGVSTMINGILWRFRYRSRTVVLAVSGSSEDDRVSCDVNAW